MESGKNSLGGRADLWSVGVRGKNPSKGPAV